jgi:predicted GTPase
MLSPVLRGTIDAAKEEVCAMTAMCTMGLAPVVLDGHVDALAAEYVVRLRAGTPIDLGRPIKSKYPIRHARYELLELGSPTLLDGLAPLGARMTAMPALI